VVQICPRDGDMGCAYVDTLAAAHDVGAAAVRGGRWQGPGRSPTSPHSDDLQSLSTTGEIVEWRATYHFGRLGDIT